MSSEPAFRSPKPLPLIRDPTFIPKSAGGSVAAPAPPAAPSKPTSPHARSAPRLSVPQYYAGSADIILKSPHFNSRSKRPILEQCFDSIQKIGEGSFAEVRFGSWVCVSMPRQRVSFLISLCGAGVQGSQQGRRANLCHQEVQVKIQKWSGQDEKTG
eukprot:m.472975 g.472975  ORF g.472975 m.472975 type:complete len:157 (-) comp57117_c0_seq5:735-1205(-)